MQFNPYEIGHAIAMEINVGLAKAYGTVAAFLHQFPRSEEHTSELQSPR